MKEKFIYRIVDRDTKQEKGVYSRADNHDVYDFGSPESARSSNCHDIYKDKHKYGIRKYKVTIELIEDDTDGKREDFEKPLSPPDAFIKAMQDSVNQRLTP